MDSSIANSISTFNNLQNFIIGYLNGENNGLWYSCCPKLYDETVPMLENLIKINELKYITISSQPGKDACDCSNDCFIQRAYILIMVLNHNYEKFKKNIIDQNLQIYCLESIRSDCIIYSKNKNNDELCSCHFVNLNIFEKIENQYLQNWLKENTTIVLVIEPNFGIQEVHIDKKVLNAIL